jgi:hypothetical protein|tara:strand:+ start:1673 stop:1792 length:120 start_codon:yes stop_codon:yes gene_type:complete
MDKKEKTMTEKEESDVNDEDILDGKQLHDLYRHTTKLIK